MNISVTTIFSNTLRLYYFFNVKDHVSHPYYNMQHYTLVYFNLFDRSSERGLKKYEQISTNQYINQQMPLITHISVASSKYSPNLIHS